MNAIKSNRVDEPNISTSKEMNVLLKQGVKKIEDEKEQDAEDNLIIQKRLILPSFDLEETKPD